jgi:hypothetical protein
MKKIFIILLAVYSLYACSNSSNKRVNEKSPNMLATNLKIEELKYIYTFINEKGETLGKLYGKLIDDSTYSDFLIMNEVNGKIAPIFAIEKATFQNIHGKEPYPINSDNFYGYNILALAKDNMDLGTLFQIDGRILKGDPVDILWTKSEGEFKVLITP